MYKNGMDKMQYTKDKIILRLQNTLSFPQIAQVKSLLNNLNNLDMMNVSAESFEKSTVGWLTASKIIENIYRLGEDLSLDNFAKHYMLSGHSTSFKSRHVVDENVVEETLSSKFDRILSEFGEMDLSHDFDFDQLTEDGLRNNQLVDQDFTTLDGVELIDISSVVPVVKVAPGEPILSPFTGGELIYKLDSDTFLDLESNQEFKVKYI
jgi:hypothetical protein